MNPTFEDYLKAYKKTIKSLCGYYCERDRTKKIEMDDLLQEANLKLFEIHKAIPIEDKGYIKRIIRNHLVDYIRNWTKDLVYSALDAGLLNQDY